MPYMHIGKTVYKKNPDGSRGEKVGTTKGDVKKYLAALYANAPDASEKPRSSKVKRYYDLINARPGE